MDSRSGNSAAPRGFGPHTDPLIDMDGFLNVKALPAAVSPVSAVGDGCADDTTAIQNAVNALKRSDAQPQTCLVSGAGKWPPYYAGLYFPAGVYRITAPIVMPYLQQARLFGDGGRGGEHVGAPTTSVGLRYPKGSVLRQDTPNQPILVFTSGDSFGVAVERLGFTWGAPQTPPPGWQPTELKAPLPPSYTTPGAVGVLFSGGGRLPGIRTDMYYHFRITGCTFRGGWRGVAIDETYAPSPDGTIAVFATQIDHCTFHQLTGAAVSLVNRSGREVGMTANALRDLFVENYNRVEADGSVSGRSINQEDQIRLVAQACCTLDGIDAEGSKTRVLSAVDCVLEVTNLYLEHVEVRGLYPKLLYFGLGRYAVRGVNLDGLMFAETDDNLPVPGPSFSTIINGEGGADITLSGVRAYPFAGLHDAKGNPTPAIQRDPDVDGGFLPLNGPAFLVGGGEATYHLLDRPQLPIYPAAERGQVTYEPAGQTLTLAYREAATFADGAGAANMTAVVRVPRAKAKRTLDFPSIPKQSVGVLRLGECVGPVSDDPELAPVPGAMPGDVVVLGPPANLPAGLVASGVVLQPGCVEIRLFNATASAVNPPAGAWTVEVGGGPSAGVPQETTDYAALTPPYARRPTPPVY